MKGKNTFFSDITTFKIVIDTFKEFLKKFAYLDECKKMGQFCSVALNSFKIFSE